jgi:hypothetical protein
MAWVGPKSFMAAMKEAAFPELTSVTNRLRSTLARVSSCVDLASTSPNTKK